MYSWGTVFYRYFYLCCSFKGKQQNFVFLNQGGEPTSRSRANNCKYLTYQNKIISDQIRKSATSQVLQGRFQRRKKQ